MPGTLTLRTLQIAAVIAVLLCWLPTSAPGHAQKADPIASAEIKAWNDTIGTMDEEADKFRELHDSLALNPPGRVLLAPDVRASQRRRRLKLIEEIIALHTARLKNLQALATHEKALQ